jgi:flagellar motor switch protein FliN
MAEVTDGQGAVAGKFTEALKSVLATMTGEAAQVSLDAATGAPQAPDGWWWSLAFSPLPDAPLIVGGAAAAWSALGKAVLAALGIDSASDEDIEATCRDLLSQCGSTLAQWLSEQQGATVVCGEAARCDPAGDASRTAQVSIAAGSPVSFSLAIPQKLADAAGPKPAAKSPWSTPLLSSIRVPIDVVLGRVTLQLSDVYKLDVGSVLDLERHIAEPAEIIVNGRVIAWGHVVVCAGNYGVKIAAKAK